MCSFGRAVELRCLLKKFGYSTKTVSNESCEKRSPQLQKRSSTTTNTTMSKRSSLQLAGSYRLNDKPLWNRASQTKILDKFYKGISLSELKKLQFGSSGNIKSRLQAENKKVIEVMTKRGPGSLKKHPPVGVDFRLTGREPIVPRMETVLDVNMFISETGNIHTDKEAALLELRSIAALESREQKQLELHRLHRLIHSQRAGTSTNTIMSRFRTHFQRANIFYLLSSTTDSHGQTIPCKRTESSGKCITPEDYLKEALHDICVAIHMRKDIAPAFYNRALILRKLHCHEAGAGDIVHALKLLFEDVGNNELAMIKYRRLAALLEREVGLFIESAMEYNKVKNMHAVHIEHEKKKHNLAKKNRLARRMKDSKVKFKIELKLKQKEEQINIHQTSMKTRLRRLSTKVKFLPSMEGNNGEDGEDVQTDHIGENKNEEKRSETPGNGLNEQNEQNEKAKALIKKKLGGGFLNVVHQLTGGKHMSAVLKAKKKFLHGLLSPVAKAMAGTVAGDRTAPQIQRIIDYIYSTKSDDLISLNSKAMKQVCQWIEHQSIAAGQYVFRTGEPQDGFYVLASGMAQVMVVHPKLGYEIPVKTLYPGDSFGKIHFPTEIELAHLEKKEEERAARERHVEAVAAAKRTDSKIIKTKRLAAPGKKLVRQSSIMTRAWASDSVDNSSNARRASIYASRHCELLVLKWSHTIEATKSTQFKNLNEHTTNSKLKIEFDANKQHRQKEAVRSFQDHTVQRRFDILKKCNVFKHMRDKDLKRIATVGTIQQWHQGKIVMHQGEVLTQVVVLIRGVCEVRKRRKMSEVQKERRQKISPTGEGEDPLAIGMMWDQQYKQHMDHRKKDWLNAQREAAAAQGNGLKGMTSTQWVQVGTVKGGDICGEMVLLNPTQSTVSPIEIIADTSVCALVLSLGELKPFINHGMFSGRTTAELIKSVGMHVPSELKVTLDLAAKRRWNKKKSIIIKSHVLGTRHMHPVGWIDPEASPLRKVRSDSIRSM